MKEASLRNINQIITVHLKNKNKNKITGNAMKNAYYFVKQQIQALWPYALNIRADLCNNKGIRLHVLPTDNLPDWTSC